MVLAMHRVYEQYNLMEQESEMFLLNQLSKGAEVQMTNNGEEMVNTNLNSPHVDRIRQWFYPEYADSNNGCGQEADPEYQSPHDTLYTLKYHEAIPETRLAVEGQEVSHQCKLVRAQQLQRYRMKRLKRSYNRKLYKNKARPPVQCKRKPIRKSRRPSTQNQNIEFAPLWVPESQIFAHQAPSSSSEPSVGTQPNVNGQIEKDILDSVINWD